MPKRWLESDLTRYLGGVLSQLNQARSALNRVTRNVDNAIRLGFDTERVNQIGEEGMALAGKTIAQCETALRRIGATEALGLPFASTVALGAPSANFQAVVGKYDFGMVLTTIVIKDNEGELVYGSDNWEHLWRGTMYSSTTQPIRIRIFGPLVANTEATDNPETQIFLNNATPTVVRSSDQVLRSSASMIRSAEGVPQSEDAADAISTGNIRFRAIDVPAVLLSTLGGLGPHGLVMRSLTGGDAGSSWTFSWASVPGDVLAIIFIADENDATPSFAGVEARPFARQIVDTPYIAPLDLGLNPITTIPPYSFTVTKGSETYMRCVLVMRPFMADYPVDDA